LVGDADNKLKPTALLCTDLLATPEQILTWFTLFATQPEPPGLNHIWSIPSLGLG